MLPLLELLEPPVNIDSDVIYSPQASKREIREFIALWSEADTIAIDLETTGWKDDDGLKPWSGLIRLVQIGLPSGMVGVFDLGSLNEDRDAIASQLNELGFFKTLKQTVESNKVVKIGHNIKFDCCWLIEQLDVHPRNLRDVMLASKVYWAGIKQMKHSLKDVSKRVLGIDVDKTEQNSEWGGKLKNRQINYAANDVKILFPLYNKLKTMLEARNLLSIAGIECGAIAAFSEMQVRGFPINVEKLDRAIAQHEDAMATISKPFFDKFPQTSITASTKTLAPLFTATFKTEIADAADETLQRLQHHAPIKALMLWRTLKKTYDYLIGMRENSRNGKCYGNYNHLGPTGTGRSTCSSINLQNPAKPASDKELVALNLISIREIFEAPQGYSLLVSDLSSAHARIAAEASRDISLDEIYLGGKEMHCVTAANLAKLKGLNWDWEYINKVRKDKNSPDMAQAAKLRDLAKTVFYGSLNGQGAKTLQATALKGGVNISIDEAKLAIQAWRNTYPDLYRFQNQVVAIANSSNHRFDGIDMNFGCLTSLSGRQCFLAKFWNEYQERNSVKLSDACSFYWMSTEADVMKISMMRVQEAFDKHPEWDAWITNFCHDELDVCCKKEFELDVAKVVLDTMHKAMARYLKIIPVDEEGNEAKNLIAKTGKWSDK